MFFSKKAKSLFISYSRENAWQVKPIVEIMRATGCEVFYDSDSIEAGKKWRVELSKALSDSDAILVFWSKDSAQSEEVTKEYLKAIELDQDIIPVLLDDTPLEASLSDYQFVDLRYGVPGLTWISTATAHSRDILDRLGFKAAQDGVEDPYKVSVVVSNDSGMLAEARKVLSSLDQNGFSVTFLQEDFDAEWRSSSFHDAAHTDGLVLLFATLEDLDGSSGRIDLNLYQDLVTGSLVPITADGQQDKQLDIYHDILDYSQIPELVEKLSRWKRESSSQRLSPLNTLPSYLATLMGGRAAEA